MIKSSLHGNVICRNVKVADLDFVYDCLYKLFEEDNNIEKFTQTIDTLFDALFSGKSFAECIIAQVNEVPVGMLLFSVTQHNFTIFPSPGVFVHHIYVIHEFRRKGVARQLGNHLKKIAESRNYSRIDGIVLKNNQNALAFYQNIQDLNVLDYIYYTRLHLK